MSFEVNSLKRIVTTTTYIYRKRLVAITLSDIEIHCPQPNALHRGSDGEVGVSVIGGGAVGMTVEVR